ncbi:hypothetical protein MMC10_006472 [Thelotrema lepadinum]|nr:hypothetical protein [Thelotrema lepadinum]
MALGRRHREPSSIPALWNEESKTRQHALSLEGAGRFWKPLESRDRESAWNFLKRKGDRSRALSSPRPQDPGSSLTSNIGQWLDDQSTPNLPEQASTNDTSSQVMDGTPSAPKHRSSVSHSGSDSISVHTLSSTTSVTNGASTSRFKSLAEQIADDERRKNAKQHLRRIMEAEEARVAQHDPESEEETTLDPEKEIQANAKDRFFPNPLRLTFEPQEHGWDINDFFPDNTRPSSTDSLPDYETSNELHHNTLDLTQQRTQSNAGSSTHTVTLVDEKDMTGPASSIPQTGETEKEGLPAEYIQGDQPMNNREALQDNDTKEESLVDSFSMPSPPNSIPTPPSTASTRNTPTSSTSSPQIPALPQEESRSPAIADTIFQDLNRLKMSPGIRQGPFTSPSRPTEASRAHSTPNILPIAKRSPPPPSSVPNPPPTFATVAPPRPPQASPLPLYKEILTPPIPSNIVELSTSPSVIHRVKAPKVHERYRRNRQHADPSVYNTLPHESYPLLPAEPRFEAPPREEEIQKLIRSKSPPKPAEIPVRKVDAHRPISIEPDIDPRTGLPWLGRGL